MAAEARVMSSLAAEADQMVMRRRREAADDQLAARGPSESLSRLARVVGSPDHVSASANTRVTSRTDCPAMLLASSNPDSTR